MVDKIEAFYRSLSWGKTPVKDCAFTDFVISCTTRNIPSCIGTRNIASRAGDAGASGRHVEVVEIPMAG